MGKFRQFLMELSAGDMSIFSFMGYNLSKEQGIFTKLAICIEIKEIWFGIANGQISTNFLRSYLPETCPYFRFWMIT